MADDQWKKKQVNAASLIGCTRDKYMVKRKKLHAQQHDLNMRPNVSLEWDSRTRSVVSKKEQIGLSKRHMIPYIEPGSRSQNILADVFPVPPEIFELDSLCEVLSYEVWLRHLSDDERSFLSQFLPKELEPDKVIRDLLSGDSLHFGNLFTKWSASLCLGELHPDNVVHYEQSLKDAKEAYYSFLKKYHKDMIDNLQRCKEKWSNCDDDEVDIVQNIWSTRKRDGKNMPTSDSRLCVIEENHVATPDSFSWANSEIAYSSENQNLGTVHGDSHRERSSLKKISDSSSGGLKVAAARKRERLQQWNIQQNDGARYMSYIKVSRKQHERVKSSIKYAGNSIQPRSLNNVLGSFDALNVQPFARFEEEECKKLHEYWVKLVTEDILVGFVNRRRIQLQRQEQMQSLREEITQKVKMQETLDEEKDVSRSNLMELSDSEGELPPSNTVLDEENLMELSDGEGELPPSNTVEEVEKEQSDDLLQEQSVNEEPIPEMASEIEDRKEIRNGYIFAKRTCDDTEMNEDGTNHVFVQDYSEPQVSSLDDSPRSMIITSSSPGFRQINSLDSNPHTNSMEMESHCDSVSAKDEDPQILSGYSGNMNHISLSQGPSVPPSSQVWPVGDAHSSYYRSTAPNSGYASTHDMSIGHPPFMQRQAVQMLNLETIRQEKDARKDMLHRQTDDMSLFSSYSDQDQSEMLHSLLKGQRSLSYHQPQKHSGIDFLPGNDILMESAHFSGQFRELVHPPGPMDVRQKRPNDPYMHHNIQEGMFSGGRFAVPRQDDLAVNVHNWTTVNGVRLPVPCQPHLNSGELSQNWYTTENGNRDGWPSLEPAGTSHSFNSGAGNSDQTLFSVLSECNKLPRVSYDAVGSTERLIQAGNYNGMVGGVHSSSNFLTQTPSPLSYLSGHEASAGTKLNTVGWMGLPLQNSGMQESIGKSFLRSWNQ